MVRTMRCSTFILNVPFLNLKVTCLTTCLLLYWPKIHGIFLHFSLFWHRVSFFLFSSIKNITIRYKNMQKKERKANVSATYCPKSVSKTVQIILWETPVTMSSYWEKYILVSSLFRWNYPKIYGILTPENPYRTSSYFLSEFTYHRKLCYKIGGFFRKNTI